MKYIFYIFFLSVILFAQESYKTPKYETGKIDMHGDAYQNSYHRSNFSTSSMGASLFLDKNTSKKNVLQKTKH